MTYWFPKAFGFRLHEGWGKAAFWFALHRLLRHLHAALRRRPARHDAAACSITTSRAWRPWLLIAAAAGSSSCLCGAVCQVIQLVVSIRRREELRDATGDPWDGRSLEWATASPPPAFNFAVLPQRAGRGAVLGDQAARDRDAAACRRAGLRADRDAAQQPDRLHHRLLRHHHRLRADLAHLVAGRSSGWSPPTRSSCGSPGATSTNTTIPAEEVARLDRARRRAPRAVAARRSAGEPA